MAAQTITLHLPEDLYNRLKHYAEQRNRTLEEELLDVVALALPQDTTTLPVDVTAELEELALLDDNSLWRAAQTHLSSRQAKRLEALHFKQQGNGLSLDEADEAAKLTRQYERAMLVRAQAVSILAERGHDVSALLGAK